MIPSTAPLLRESPLPVSLLFSFLSLISMVTTVAPFASAQYQTYPIYTDVSAVPAGSFGVTFQASAIDASTTANFNVCFDTGYGSSKVPIVPYKYSNQGDSSHFSFDVPPPTIQDVPPSAFVNGSFPVSIYSVPTSLTACTGNEPGTSQGNTVTLNYPVLRSVTLAEIPEQNVALKAREPSNLALTGANFSGNTGSTGKVPSVVRFISSSTEVGTVKFISNSSLVSTIPLTIPTSASSVSVKVCNIATFTYCSSDLPLRTLPLKKNPGTLTASPSPAPSNQPVTLTAHFGPVTSSVAGAPSGLVTFADGSTTLGTAPLVLDRTATFTQAPSQQFSTNALPLAPIVADFNKDGIPDTLFIDPGNVTSGATLNLLLGTVPSGSFRPNSQFTPIRNGPPFLIASAVVGDYNGDGLPDIVLLASPIISATTGPLSLYTMLGNGDGTFQDGVSSSPILYGSQIVAGDFNKDGKQDIVIAGALDANQTIGLQALLGDGKGQFTAGPKTTGLRTAPSPDFGDFKIAAADFNADGYPDIVVLNGYSPQGQLDESLEVYQNSHKATFTSPVRVPTDGTATADFFVAALGRGHPLDIFVTSTSSPNAGISRYTNQSSAADIAFANTAAFTPVPDLAQVVAGDFNGDGLLDLAIQDQQTIHVLSGDGTGDFSALYSGLSINPATGTSLISATDENGDSYADLMLYITGAIDSNSQYPITLSDSITSGTATATLPSTTFAVGVQGLTASTNGTFNILAGSAATTLSITPPVPSLVLASNPASPQPYAGSATTLIGTVFDSSQNPAAGSTATGTLAFYNGNTLLGTAPLVDTGGTSSQGTDAATLNLANLAVGNYSFTARYPGDQGHAAATSAPLTFQVTPATPTISWSPNPASITYGTALSAAQLNAVAAGVTGGTIPGTFSYAPGFGTILNVGSNPVAATFTPNDPNYVATTATQNIVVTQATPSISWFPNPASILAGTPLSGAQLNATSNTPGNFAYTPAIGSVLAAGTQTLTVAFTPTDTRDFTSASTSVTIDISAGALTLSPASVNFGNQPYGTTGTPQTVLVSNPGTSVVDIASIGSQSGPNSRDFLATSNCPQSLSPQTSCQISITFTPSGVGVRRAGVVISSDSTPPTPAIRVRGTGVGGVLQIDPGTLKAIAGDGIAGYEGDRQAANDAQLSSPDGIAFDPTGNLYIADTANNVIRKVDTTGTITTFAGNGTAGLSGDSGAATNSELNLPYGVVSDASGNIYIGDAGNHVIRKVDTNGIITTFAGTGVDGHAGDGGAAINGTLSNPQGARFDKQGNLFIADCLGESVRKIDINGILTTVAGSFIAGFSGDGASATNAQLSCPAGIAIDSVGNLYIADSNNDRIRKVTTDGVITTVAGTGIIGATGDGGPAAAATFSLPSDVAFDLAGNLFVADSGDNRIRRIDTQGIVTTVAGSVSSPGSSAINSPSALATDSAGNVYFSDTGNNVVRELFPQGIAPFPDTAIGSTALPEIVTLSDIGNVPIVIPSSASFSLGGNTSDFSLTGGTCLQGATLAAQVSSCTLQISFTPTAPGPRALSVSIADNALNSPQTFTLNGTGTALPPTVNWPTPAGIVYGTPLSGAQLDATAVGLAGVPLAGVFAYTPSAGTILAAGTPTLSVLFTPTSNDYLPATAVVPITVTQATPTVTWVPSPAGITYGTALSAAQLDATSTTPGTFTYTPAIGSILPIGTQTLSVVFTPSDTRDFNSVTASATITVSQTVPTITWGAPASIAVGTPLSSTQLNATATGVSGAALPGTFTYTPSTGTILSTGTQILKVAFSPAASVDYTTATGSVSLQVLPVTLSSLSATQAALGDPAKTITLTGSGFLPAATAQVNGSAISTTFVSPTTLTAIIPASNFLLAQVLQINVVEVAEGQATAPIAFVVGAPLANAAFTGPSTMSPGTETNLSFSLNSPYPADLTASFTLGFTPLSGLPNDAGVLFANGTTSYTLVIPANTIPPPLIAIQGSTIAGSVTVRLSLQAGGVDVTPPAIQPVTIQVPLAVPGVTSVAFSHTGNTLSVLVRGLSNPRDMTLAKFHFTPVSGGSVKTEDVTIDVVPMFTTWYAGPASLQYGSTFTYTQPFVLSSDASVVGKVSVTLVNSVGESLQAETP